MCLSAHWVLCLWGEQSDGHKEQWVLCLREPLGAKNNVLFKDTVLYEHTVMCNREHMVLSNKRTMFC